MVSIQDVYNTVLTLLNKESGGGYVTPSEFNALAEKNQTKIFEEYFYELEDKNVQIAAVPNSSDYTDVAYNLRDKLSRFQANATIDINSSDANFEITDTNASNFYRIGGVFLPNFTKEIEEVQFSKLPARLGSPLSCPMESRPIYVKNGMTSTALEVLSVYPKAVFATVDGVNTRQSGVASIAVSYIRRPAKPNWIGDTTTGQPVANTGASGYQDFELHASEFYNLVEKIGADLGVVVRDVSVAQYLQTQDQLTEQKEA